MTVLTPGGNAPVSQTKVSAVIDYAPLAGVDLDISAFLLGPDGKVPDDSYFCFYGAPSVAAGSVKIASSAAGRTEFSLDLAAVPAVIDKVALTATVYENRARFDAYPSLSVRVGDIEAPIATAGMRETALILGEFYRRQGQWKFRLVAQGFEGGLSPLATNFGVDIEAAPPAPVAPAKLSLEKKVAEKAPELVSLAKKATVSLAKNKLQDLTAVLKLVLDKSGSMDWQYKAGKVQQVVNRIVPLAVHFDDNGSLDGYAFGEKAYRLTDITLDNYRKIVDTDGGGWKKWDIGWKSNNEPAVIDMVVDDYRRSGSKLPVIVIFVSDGGIDKTTAIRERIVKAASLPIFWQFVGIGGENYGVLEKLDTMTGRAVDNANFFAIDDLDSISEEELYDRLMAEIPLWLKAAKAAGILA